MQNKIQQAEIKKHNLLKMSLHFSSHSLHELISNRRKKCINQQQTEGSAVVYLMDCEWRWRTQRAVSCLLSWRPCQRSPPRNRMSNQASRPSPRPDSAPLPSPLSPVYTNLTGEKVFWIANEAERSDCRGRVVLMTKLGEKKACLQTIRSASAAKLSGQEAHEEEVCALMG